MIFFGLSVTCMEAFITDINCDYRHIMFIRIRMVLGVQSESHPAGEGGLTVPRKLREGF